MERLPCWSSCATRATRCSSSSTSPTSPSPTTSSTSAPSPGTGGSEIVFEGDIAGLRPPTPSRGATSTTGPVSNPPCGRRGVTSKCGRHRQQPATSTSTFPLGVLVKVTGVAGSGKSSSSMVIPPARGRRHRPGRDQGSQIQPGDLHRAARADPQGLRHRELGVKPALFSANSEGACPVCNGAGVYTDR